MLGVWCLFVLALPNRPAVEMMTDIVGEGIAFLTGIIAGAFTLLAGQEMLGQAEVSERTLTALGLRLAVLYAAACLVMWLPGTLARLPVPGWQKAIFLLGLAGITLASTWQA